MAFIAVGERYNRRPGSFIVVARLHGKRVWRTVSSHEEARKLQAKLTQQELKSPRDGGSTFPLNVTVAAYAAHWLQVNRAGWKPRTVELYQATLTRYVLPAFGSTQVRHVSRRAIKTWIAALAGRGLRRGTCKAALALLRSVLGSAVEDDLIEKNPAVGARKALPRASEPEPDKGMDAAQLAAFLRAVDGPRVPADVRTMFYTLALGGMRAGEVLGLQVPDVDLRAGTLTIQRTLAQDAKSAGPPKTKRSARTLTLSPVLADVLRQYLLARSQHPVWSTTSWLFPSSSGRPRRQESLRRAMATLLRRAGLPRRFTPHSLRHSFASLMLTNGANAKAVQQHLGHASLAMTTDVYGNSVAVAADTAILDKLVATTVAAPVRSDEDRVVATDPERWAQRMDSLRVASLVAEYAGLRAKVAEVRAEPGAVHDNHEVLQALWPRIEAFFCRADFDITALATADLARP